MARKLQGEIDRVLKKVAEGNQEFDQILKKVYSASSSNQKEKYESDLKKEIKKLQRYRDQIKQWIASNDVKDKRPLIEARKAIENQMEQFKICEKETKTKAYSKEGLSQSHAPKNDAVQEARNWISKALAALQQQQEQAETDLETARAKKGRKDTTLIEALERKIERHRFHSDSLEKVLRMLDNETLSVDKVAEIRDGVEYYIESNNDPDFVEDENIYESIGIVTGDDEAENGEISDDENEIDANEKEEEESAEEKASPAPTPTAPAPIPAAGTTPSPAAAPAPTPAANSVNKRNAPAAAAAATASTVSPRTQGPPQAQQPPARGGAQAAASQPQPSAQPHRGKPAPAPSAAALSSGATGPLPRGVIRTGPGGPAQPSQPQPHPPQSRAGQSQGTPAQAKPPSSQPPASFLSVITSSSASAPASSAASETPAAATAAPPPPVAAPHASAPLQVPPSQHPPAAFQPNLPASGAGLEAEGRKNADTFDAASSSSSPPPPGTLADLAASTTQHLPPPAGPHPVMNEKPPAPAGPATGAPVAMVADASQGESREAVSAMLETSLRFLPDSGQQEGPRTYVPRNPFPTPAYYPQAPLLLDNPALFERLDTDTLFFIFYYQQGTLQQYLAAKELKKQHWRFHKKYLTWFQRHEEPKEITNDYEQGTYVYFDYETGWCQRKKAEFTFEYRYLEDEEL